MDVDNELALVQAARAGDMHAFEQLYIQTSPLIRRSANHMVGAQDADDVVQDTYIRALTALGSFRGECRLVTWLHRILSNQAAGHKRKTFRHPMTAISLDHLAAPARDQHIEIDLMRGLNKLPSTDRKIISRRLNGYSDNEIAREIGVPNPNSTIRSRRRRARAKMRAVLSRKRKVNFMVQPAIC